LRYARRGEEELSTDPFSGGATSTFERDRSTADLSRGIWTIR